MGVGSDLLWTGLHRWRFVYRPGKLEAAVAEIASRCSLTAIVEERRHKSTAVNLKPLLEAIAGAGSEEALRELASSLSVREITALFFAIPEVREAEVSLKVTRVVIWRRARYLLGHAWAMFKAHPRNPACGMLLAEALTQGVGPDLPERYRVLLDKSLQMHDPAEAMASHLLAADDLLLVDLMTNMGVENDCALYDEVLGHYLLGCTRRHLLREGGADVAFYARRLQISLFRRFTERYLTEMEPEFFQREITTLILNRLGRPEDPHNRRWEGIDEGARRKFQRWLVESDLKLFFSEIAGDPARWRYWQQHIASMRDVFLQQDPPILVMLFPRGVAVEFGRPGNAAYLYTHEVWASIRKALRGRTPWRPQDLKFRDLCVGRIVHMGWWEMDADYDLKQIL